MGIERIVSTTVSENDTEEEVIEKSLRPLTFDEYIGQDRMKNNLKIAIDAVKKRKESGDTDGPGSTLDHILLYGPPGLGKTTMAAVIAHEMEIYKAQAAESGKPEAIQEKIATGRLEKFFKEQCLAEQTFVKDNDITVLQYVNGVAKQLGGSIKIAGFVRFLLGE